MNKSLILTSAAVVIGVILVVIGLANLVRMIQLLGR
jgi:hypothetical protein